jgi:hypothetical protein
MLNWNQVLVKERPGFEAEVALDTILHRGSSCATPRLFKFAPNRAELNFMQSG